MGILGIRKTYKVYVDATISNMQDLNLPKEAFVAYVVEGSKLRGVQKVEASETDDAELQAILFAMDELNGKLKRFIIFCDHESVVSQVKLEQGNYKLKNQFLNDVRSRLRANPSIKVDLFNKNPAHRYLKKHLIKKCEIPNKTNKNYSIKMDVNE